MKRASITYGFVGTACLGAAVASGQPCLTWGPVIGSPGVNGQILGLQTFDFDGTGPEGESVVVFGRLQAAGNLRTSGVARWNGKEWMGAGSGTTQRVTAAVAFDPDGTGPVPSRLVLATLPQGSGTPPPQDLLWWNGDLLESFVPSATGGGFNLLAVFDEDGPGPRSASLFAAFYERLYRLNGDKWELVGEAPNIDVGQFTASVLFDPDSGGPEAERLVIAGRFSEAFTLHNTECLWEWNGVEWKAIGGAQFRGGINAVAVFDPDAAGPLLPVIVAAFREHNLDSLERVLAWNGASWTPMGAGLTSEVFALQNFDPDGAGPLGSELIAVENSGLRRWTGSEWEPLTNPSPTNVQFITSVTMGEESNALVAAGWSLVAAGDSAVAEVAMLHGNSWGALGIGLTQPFEQLAQFDVDGEGAEKPVIIGAAPAPSQITASKRVLLTRIEGEWKTEAWVNNDVRALIRGGPELGEGVVIAAGSFTQLNSAPCASIAQRSDIGAWSPMGVGADAPINTMCCLPDAATGGTRLIVGGEFQSIGGVAASRIAAWDGLNWLPLGAGLNGTVTALAVADLDGEGGEPACVYAAGAFGASGLTPLRSIARWDGVSWESVGDGLLLAQPVASAPIVGMIEFDLDGVGPQNPVLVAAGPFGPQSTGARFLGVAYWNGQNWFPFAAGIEGQVKTLLAHDWDGRGPMRPRLLVVGSILSKATSLHGVGEWNGDAWLPWLEEEFSATTAVSVDSRGDLSSGKSLLVSRFTLLPTNPIASWSPFALESSSRLPAITSQPEDVTDYVGDFVRLDVSFATDVPAFVRWRQDGVPSSEDWARSPTARFQAAVRHNGLWEAAIVHPCGTVFSRKVRVTVTPRPLGCPGDANHDGFIRGNDLSVLLSQFGSTITPNTGADFNGDGLVDGRDLSVLLSTIGGEC